MADVTIEQLADGMYELVAGAVGQKKLKAGDLTKAMKEKYGDVPRNDTKAAIKMLIDSGRCIYGYFGGSSIELPHTEAAENK